MTVLRITNFGGLVPKLGKRLLPDANAQAAYNAKLMSGELRPWWKPFPIANLGQSGIRTVYRYTYENEDRILAFNKTTEVVEAALTNDAFDRIYYTNADGIFITTKQDLEDGIAAVPLGVPTPEFTDFDVAATGGDPDGPAETRVYLATLVSKYGEEGSPSETVQVSGPIDGVFTVTGLDSLGFDDLTYTNIETLRLYRTITSATSVDYRLVHEFPLDEPLPTSYVDDVDGTELASKPMLESLTWTPPPSGMRGLIGLSGGFNAAFKGREVWFSIPYYPHAWPEEFKLAVEDEIVALGSFSNVLVIATKGRPAIAAGSTPDAMTLELIKRPYPCYSATGLVSTGQSVIFPTPEGLLQVSPNGIDFPTGPFLTKDEWLTEFPPQGLMAAMYQNRYMGFFTTRLGFTLGFDDPATAFTQLNFEDVTAVNQDIVTGGVLLVSGDTVYEFDSSYGEPEQYVWRSKPFMAPKPMNVAGIQLRGDFFQSAAIENPPARAPGFGHTINGKVINGINAIQLGASPLQYGWGINGPGPLGLDPIDLNITTRLYADGRMVWQGNVDSEVPRRTPSGYKAVKFEVEFTGSVSLHSFAITSVFKELETVP